jgi:hypothetical protein
MPYTPKQPKTPPAAPAMPTPPAGKPMAGMSPEEIAALEAQGYASFEDGLMIPPMRGEKPPLADQTGGAGMQGDVRSDIFRNLYRQGRQSGNQTLMDMARPPMQEPGLEMPVPPWMQPQEPPFLLSASPTPSPQYQQADQPRSPGPGMQQMQQRFPRATSLLNRTRPQGGGGMGY